MHFVTGILLSTAFIASSLAGQWCTSTIDGPEYCDNGCCDDLENWPLEKCCAEEPPIWAIVVVAFGAFLLFCICPVIVCVWLLKRGTNMRGWRGRAAPVPTVHCGHQPTGFQQHPYPMGIQPPQGAGPPAPPPYPGNAQPPGGAIPSVPPPAYQTAFGQKDHSS